MNTFATQAARKLMLTSLVMDPSMRPHVRKLMRMGAKNIRPDYMYIRNYAGVLDRVVDPAAWNAKINECIGVSLLRNSDGSWFMIGY